MSIFYMPLFRQHIDLARILIVSDPIMPVIRGCPARFEVEMQLRDKPFGFAYFPEADDERRQNANWRPEGGTARTQFAYIVDGRVEWRNDFLTWENSVAWNNFVKQHADLVVAWKAQVKA